VKALPVPQRAASPRSATPSRPAARLSPPPYGMGFVDQSAGSPAPDMQARRGDGTGSDVHEREADRMAGAV
jgi:hypothetical protein